MSNESQISLKTLEKQLNEFKESTKTEIKMLRQLIRVTWRCILDERQAFWEKQVVPKNFQYQGMSHGSQFRGNDNDCSLERFYFKLSATFSNQETLLSNFEKEIPSIMRKLSFCETQIEKVF